MTQRTDEPSITPLPVPAGARLIILFGGTFDPPHRAHVELPRMVRDLLERGARAVGRGWLVYVPAARSPLKSVGPVASEEDRLAMVRLAIKGLERAVVWTDEMDRAGAAASSPSYTIDTVGRARRWLDGVGARDAGLRLLIGADQAAQFHRWKRAREIVEIAEPVVMARGPRGSAEGLMEEMARGGFWTAEELAAWRARVVGGEVMDVSSTAVRSALCGSERSPAAETEPAVMEYIRERGLYRDR